MRAIILSLLLGCAAQATITQVQQVSPGTCPAATCTATVAATKSGSILVAMFALQTSGSPVTTVTDNVGNSWQEAPNCAASAGAQAGSPYVDCWYVVNSKPGATNVTATLGGVSGSGRAVQFYEFAVSTGCLAYYDTSGSANNSTALLLQTGVALTLNGTPGTDDVIVQGIFANAGISLVGGGYTPVLASSRAVASLLGATVAAGSGAAPTWTIVPVGVAAVNAIAFVEACAVSVSMNPTQAGPLFAAQQQQFAATVIGNVNTAVSWRVTGVGSVDSTGLYTAPASIATPQTVTVTATSVADGTKKAAVTFSLNAGSSVVDTYQLSELFGVGWPDQPIEFLYKGVLPLPSPMKMTGPLGTEVPFQWVSSCSATTPATAANGCIAVRNNLPANANYTWTLVAGQTPSATPVNPVQMNTVGNNIEITNGLTGVRILTQAAEAPNLALNPTVAWSPIQGILLHDGATWTGAGSNPNFLYSEAPNKSIGDQLLTQMYTAKSYTVTVVDQGPLKTVVQAKYTFNRPQYSFGSTVINTPGTGYYTLIVTLYANSKSVLIDEESDMQFSYYLPLYSQLQPDTARYRGHDAVDGNNNSNPVCGYESPNWPNALTVSGATNARPVVITTSTANNMSDGQAVVITGVLGNLAANTPANGIYYVNSINATQFSLFSDAALTIPVAGTGAYSGGGVVKPAYRGASLQSISDAFEDLTFNANRPASYSCGNSGSTPGYRKLLADYAAAAHAAGWYVELYNSQAPGAGTTAPVVGFYSGRGSKQVYAATGPSLPGIYSSNSHFITHAQDAGIQVDNLLRGQDGTIVCPATLPCEAVVHRNWGIFVGTQADLKNPGNHQPIADEQNMLTEVNLSRLYTYQLVYPDPPGGWQPQYLPAATVANLQSQLQNGTFPLLANSETSPQGVALVGMWQATTPAAAQAAVAAALPLVTGLAAQLESALAAGDNHFDKTLGYYQLGLQTSPVTVVLNAILALSTSNPSYVTPAQKTLAKAALALFGSIFWDEDWFPIATTSGEGVGLPNQIQQYLQYRTQSVLSDPSQPFLSQQLTTALTYPANDFANYFASTGAAAGSTHYQSAFFEPLILNFMNQLTPGQLSMADPRWAAYANWELSIQTPPEPRFGNLRKGYSNGDGNTEADVRTGMLGTALYPVNQPLAQNLMWAWQQSNSSKTLTEDSQFVSTLAAIDPTIPPVVPGSQGTPPLASINIPGYHSVERHNFGTPNETALWFINGGFYSTGGHRHYDDGQVSIYALSAPLAIDWNANLYSPETPGRFMHNSIVYDGELPHLWSADNALLTDVSTLLAGSGNSPAPPINTEFAAFADSTTSTAKFTSPDGTVWSRTVRVINLNPSNPIIYVHDTFPSGPSAGAAKTLTWNLMSDPTAAVTTPTGQIKPVTRFSAGCQSPAGALPSNGNVLPLPAGLSHFTFTGAPWPQHLTKGIDWDLFTVAADSTQQFMIGNWGHGCTASRETGEYENANKVGSFAEVQDILRVHDTGPFTTIIAPYPKGQKPNRVVTQQASCGPNNPMTSVQIALTGEAYCFNDSMSMYVGTRGRQLTVYDGSTWSISGFTVSGGPQEVVSQGSQIIWTIAGVEAGTRNLTLPGTWYPKPAAGVTKTGNIFSYTYPGGQQTAPVTITFSQIP